MSALFRQEVLDSRGHSLFGGIAVPTTRASAILAAVALLAAAGVLALITFGSYASKVAVPGYLVPTAGLARVVPGRSGIVERLLVREGDVVEAGAPLFVVGSQRATPGRAVDVDSTQIERLSQDRAVLDQQMARERELSAATQTALSARIQTLRRQRASAQAQSTDARQRSELLQRDLQRLSALTDYVPRATVDERHSELLRAQQELHALDAEIERIRAEQGSVEVESLQLPTKLELRLAELQMSATSVEREISEIEHKREHVVHAPINGTVSTLTAHIGMAVLPDQPLLAMLPAGAQLEAELLVPTSAIGLVHEGQRVRLRYDAFPYQKFGLYPGVVKAVSRTALAPQQHTAALVAIDSPAYRVLVSLGSQSINTYGYPVQLQAGLTLRADLVRERRRIVAWIFDPLIAMGRAL